MVSHSVACSTAPSDGNSRCPSTSAPTVIACIDRAGMDAEPHDPARVLIYNDQDPVGTQRCQLAPEQIHTPEAVFHVAEELKGCTNRR